MSLFCWSDLICFQYSMLFQCAWEKKVGLLSTAQLFRFIVSVRACRFTQCIVLRWFLFFHVLARCDLHIGPIHHVQAQLVHFTSKAKWHLVENEHGSCHWVEWYHATTKRSTSHWVQGDAQFHSHHGGWQQQLEQAWRMHHLFEQEVQTATAHSVTQLADGSKIVWTWACSSSQVAKSWFVSGLCLFPPMARQMSTQRSHCLNGWERYWLVLQAEQRRASWAISMFKRTREIGRRTRTAHWIRFHRTSGSRIWNRTRQSLPPLLWRIQSLGSEHTYFRILHTMVCRENFLQDRITCCCPALQAQACGHQMHNHAKRGRHHPEGRLHHA